MKPSTLLSFAGLFCIIGSAMLSAQVSRIDSLKNEWQRINHSQPEKKLDLLGKLSEESMKTNIQDAMGYSLQQYNLAVKENAKSYLAEAASSIGTIFYQQGKNDSARIYFNEALSLEKQLGKQKEVHTQECNLANVYKTVGKYDTAMVLYQNALRYYEETNDQKAISQTLANIGTVYYIAGNQDKATEYTRKALAVQREIKDESGMGISLVNLLVFALNIGHYDEGIKYGEEAVGILEHINQRNYASALLRLGYCYYMKGNTEKAFHYTLQSIRIFKENKSLVGQMEGYRTLGDYYMEQKKYKLAKETGLKALAIADTTNLLDLRLLYDLLKRACIFLNEPDEAVRYSNLQIKMKEAAINEQWAEKIADVDTRYQTAKKEREIEQLEAGKERQTATIRLMILLLLIVSGVGVFLFKYMQQRKILAEQRVKQLEQERQLVASNALLQGEESERSRLARDLHDGLGGLLTGIKMKLMNIKGNAVISEEGIEQFDRALDLMDTSLKELRSVAHNLMPETLIKFGLREAVDEYCTAAQGTSLRLSFQFFGTSVRLDSKMEVGIFRIVQELVTNIMKHSGATDAMIQLVMEEGRLSLTVQDNGKGMNLEELKRKTGKGIPGIHSRVNAMSGSIDISSNPGQGTEITVEIPLPVKPAS